MNSATIIRRLTDSGMEERQAEAVAVSIVESNSEHESRIVHRLDLMEVTLDRRFDATDSEFRNIHTQLAFIIAIGSAIGLGVMGIVAAIVAKIV